MPSDYPNANSYYWRKQCHYGTKQRINDRLRHQDRERPRRQPESSAAVVDSQSVKPTEAAGERGYDAGTKVKERKQYIVVDTFGNLLEVAVHAANIQDRNGARFDLTKLSQATQEAIKKISKLLRVLGNSGVDTTCRGNPCEHLLQQMCF